MPTPNGPQFKKVVKDTRPRPPYVRDIHNVTRVSSNPQITETVYEYVKPDPDDPFNEFAEGSHAILSVEHIDPETETKYPRWYEYTDEWAENTPIGEQIPLFEHTEKPATNRVTFLRSTQEARTIAPILLGIADYESQVAGRPSLTPSRDLSQHSLRMVKNLEDKGVTSTPLTKPTNTLGFIRNPKGESGNTRSWEGGTVIPDATVKAGRRRMRDVLRTPKSQPQYEQLNFEGMD